MNTRIKLLRKSLHLTQQEFSERLGSEQNTISSYEIGRTKPSSAMINNICKTYNVNEIWLRTGEGDMFLTKSEDEDIAAYINSVLHDEPESIRRRFISAIAVLSDDDLRAVERFARALLRDGGGEAAEQGEDQR